MFGRKFWFFNFHISQNETISGADLEGGAGSARPLYFFAEIGRLTLCGRPSTELEFCAPHAKRMHQIVRIDFENYNFSPLLRGHIPLRHPLSPQAPKFCQSLIWAPPLLKNPGSAPEYQQCQFFRIFSVKSSPPFFYHFARSIWTKNRFRTHCIVRSLTPAKIRWNWAFLHIFSMQKRPSFYIRCCKIPVYRFYSTYAHILSQI